MLLVGIPQKTQIMIDADHSYYEVGTAGIKGKKLKKAEITLNDCLACSFVRFSFSRIGYGVDDSYLCSGCITSAESVLVSIQSHEEVYRVLAEQPVRLAPFDLLAMPADEMAFQNLTPILSIAPQSVASLAALHNLSPSTTMRGLRAFFKKELGFRCVPVLAPKSILLQADTLPRSASSSTPPSPAPSPSPKTDSSSSNAALSPSRPLRLELPAQLPFLSSLRHVPAGSATPRRRMVLYFRSSASSRARRRSWVVLSRLDQLRNALGSGTFFPTSPLP